MTPPLSSADIDTVFANSSWVRELALQLVDDGSVADDLLQDAYVLAQTKRDSVRSSFPAWIGTVLRNLVRERARSERRRGAREQATARDGETPSTVDVVEKLALHRRVSDAMLELSKPYQEALYLRYFEDLPPTKIAKSLGIPVSTVKTRLDRAIKQMRRSLDDAHGGDRRAWALPLLASPLSPLSPAPTPPTPLVANLATLSPAKVAIVFVGVALAVVLGVTGFGGDAQPGETLLDVKVANATPRTVEGVVIAQSPGTGTERFLAPAPKIPRAAQLPGLVPSAGREALRGRVLGVGGARQVAVEVRFVPTSGFPSDTVCHGTDRPGDLTDLEGGFAIEGVTDRGVVLTSSPELQTLFAGRVLHDLHRSRPTVVVAPRRDYRGKVLDDAGVGVSFATVQLDLPPNLRSSLGIVAESSLELPVTTQTDRDGQFTLAKSAFVHGARLRAQKLGYVDGFLSLNEEREAELTIRLRSNATTSDSLAGIVVDAANRPTEGALVSDGIHVTSTDASGHFYLSRASAGPRPKRLIAVLAGHQPAYSAPIDRKNSETITLRLGPTPLTISGQIVDGEDRPMVGAIVWVSNPTLFAHRHATHGKTEETRIEGVGSNRDPWVVENLTAGLRKRMWAPTRTDDQGRFVLRGLSSRPYRVAVMNRDTLEIVRAESVDAGTTDLLLQLQNDPAHRTVRGRVEFAGGAAAPAVSIGLQWELLRLRSIHGRAFHAKMHRRRVQTGDDGTFELPRVPNGTVHLFFEDGGILPIRRELKAGVEADIRVEATRRAHVQVILEAGESADAIGFVTESGQRSNFHLILGSRHTEGILASIESGRSEVLAVSESVARVEFFKAGKLTRSVSVSLVPGRLRIIR